MFLNNRYHDPALGAFLSVDPLVTTTGEPYIYGSANPTTLSDPSGLCSSFVMNAEGNWTCTLYTRDDGSRSVDNQGGDLCNRGARICSVDQGKLPADYVFGDQKPDKYRGIPTSLLAYEAPRDPFDVSGLGGWLARFTTLDGIRSSLWEYANLKARGASQGPGLPAEIKPLTSEEFVDGVRCVAAIEYAIAVGAAGQVGAVPRLASEPVEWAADRGRKFVTNQVSSSVADGLDMFPSLTSCIDVSGAP